MMIPIVQRGKLRTKTERGLSNWSKDKATWLMLERGLNLHAGASPPWNNLSPAALLALKLQFPSIMTSTLSPS